MVRKKIKIIFFISIFLVLSISIILVINNFIVLNKIYYKEDYDVNLSNSEELIEKAENFNYLKYIKMHNSYGETQNLTQFNLNYINREFINFLKAKIDRDNKRFHLWSSYYHHFIYTFNATEEASLFFSYNNNTIFNATNKDHEVIFIVNFDQPVEIPPMWFNCIGSWYINVTQVTNQSSIILLNNIILVKMTLIYDHLYGSVGGEFYQIEQYIVFNANLQVIFIYIPATQLIVA